jgi:hypothetical protein
MGVLTLPLATICTLCLYHVSPVCACMPFSSRDASKDTATEPLTPCEHRLQHVRTNQYYITVHACTVSQNNPRPTRHAPNALQPSVRVYMTTHACL